MPKVTRENTIEFIKKHLTLFATSEEQKLTEADAAVQARFKAIKNISIFQETLIKIADEMTTSVKKDKDNIENRLKKIVSDSLDGFYRNTIGNTASLMPVTLMGISGGFFGKMMSGGGAFGLLVTLVGALCGIILGSRWSVKPGASATMVSLEMARLLSERFPDSKEKIVQIIAEKLFSNCHSWANTHGGWAEAILNTVDLDKVNNMAQENATLSTLRLA